MKRKFTRRVSSVLLSLAVFMAFSFMIPQQAGAASKTKSFYVMTELKESSESKSQYGKDKPYTSKDSTKHTYAYNKNGLQTSTKISSGQTIKYSRNSAGFVTASKTYEKGKLTYQTNIKRNKDQDMISSTSYSFDGGKKTKSGTTSFTYWKKGVVKKSTSKSKASSYTSSYSRKGIPVKDVSKNSYDGKTVTTTYVYDITLDKNGNYKKEIITQTTTGGDKQKSTRTYKYTYGKNKRINKEVSNTTTVDKKGKKIGTEKITVTNTYYKNGKLKKSVYESKSVDGDYTRSYKSTTTYKYKKVKVPKKYWKLFEQEEA